METHDFSKAKVGDKVTCLTFGKGEIIDILNIGFQYRLHVKMKKGNIQNYAFDGKWRWDSNSTLFHGHVDFKIETIPICPYKKDEYIAVANHNVWWVIGKFIEMTESGVVVDVYGISITFKFHKKLSEFNT